MNPSFKKGMPKVPGSGRKKGSLNKKKLKKTSEILAENDLNPVHEIVEVLRVGDLKDKERADIWFDLLSYCEAKPKAIEADNDDLDPAEFENLSSADLLSLVKKPHGPA